jgi:hypothetical protein
MTSASHRSRKSRCATCSRSSTIRYDRRSTLITSQLPVDQWHAYLGDRTVADAILDRLVHNSYRLVLKGESMRKRRGSAALTASPKAKQR